MTVTRANLLTLAQCRPLWLWHFWGAAVCLAALLRPLLGAESAREGAVFGVLVVPIWCGVLYASLAKDFLARPFAFCIPSLLPAWRRTLSGIALLVAAICTMVFLFVPGQSADLMLTRMWTIFFLTAGLFMASVMAAMKMPNTGFLPALITLFLLISYNDNLALELRTSVDTVLMMNPVLTAGVGAAIAVASWVQMGRRSLARQRCGAPFLPLHGSFSGQRQAEFAAGRRLQRMRKSPGAFLTSMDNLFLARMRALSGRPAMRALWGALYVQAGKTAPARFTNFIALAALLIVVTVIAGLYHPHRFGTEISAANLVIFLVCVINAEYRIDPYATLLLNVSRRNRLQGILFSAVSQWLLVAAAAALLTAASHFVGRYIDEITIYGHTYGYSPIHPKAFFAFAPMLPFFYLSQLLFPKQHVLVIMVIAAISTVSFMSAGYKLLDAPVTGLVLLQAACWLPFVAAISHYYFRRDLKLDGR